MWRWSDARGGEVEGEAPGGNGADLVQTHELDAFASGQFAFHVGELAAVADVHGGQLGPSRAGSRGQFLGAGEILRRPGTMINPEGLPEPTT